MIDAGREEADVLERVHRRVADGGLVQERQVPDVEVDRPERQRHRGVGEHAQALDGAEREQRPQHRPGEAGEQAERREVADQDVLEHVEAEELLLADRGDRRGEGEQEQDDPERRRATTRHVGHRRARGGAACVRAAP